MTPGRLPPTLNAEEVAQVWGISAWFVYQGHKAGSLPVAPLHLGRLLRWSSIAVYASVGLDVAAAVTSAAAQVRSKDDETPAAGANLRSLPRTEGAAR